MNNNKYKNLQQTAVEYTKANYSNHNNNESLWEKNDNTIKEDKYTLEEFLDGWERMAEPTDWDTVLSKADPYGMYALLFCALGRPSKDPMYDREFPTVEQALDYICGYGDFTATKENKMTAAELNHLPNFKSEDEIAAEIIMNDLKEAAA